jgi:TRAP-type mannitol/chloroaromatic compound transport system permease large subunit
MVTYDRCLCTGALILAMFKKRLTWDLVRQAAESTAKLSAFVVQP